MPGPSGRAPKKLYWLDIVTVGKLRYRQTGGGKFTNLDALRDRQWRLAQDGIDSVGYESKPIEWVELPPEEYEEEEDNEDV